MHPYFYPYVLAPVFIRRNLKGLSSKTDTVVGTYCPFMLLAQDVVQTPDRNIRGQACPHPLHPLDKRCPLFSCRAHKLLIVGRHIYLCPITIGFLHVGYPMIGKVLWKAAPDVSQMPVHCVPLPLGSRQVSYLFPDASLPCQTLSRYVFKRDA